MVTRGYIIGIVVTSIEIVVTWGYIYRKSGYKRLHTQKQWLQGVTYTDVVVTCIETVVTRGYIYK